MKFNYNFPRVRYCPKGHAIVAGNLSIKRRYIGCRVCRLAADSRDRQSPRIGEPVIRRVIDALNEGQTFNAIHGLSVSSPQPAIVAFTRLKAFMAANPAIGKWMKGKATANMKRVYAERNTARRIQVAAPALARNLGVLDEISAALTMWLDPHTERPDILQAMWIAVADGRLARADIKVRARGFVTAHRRGYTNIGRFAFGSLDAPAYRDSPVPLIETISQGIWS